MKKLITLILISTLLFSCKKDKDEEVIAVTNEPEFSDLSHYNLYGPVKSVEEKSFEIIDGRNSGSLKRETYSEYDFVLEFNQKGQLIREKKFNSTGALHEETIYDGKNQIVDYIQYMNNAVFLTTKHTRDDKGNTIIITRRNPDGSQYDKIVQTFIDSKLVQKRNFDANERLMSKISFTYDEKGNLIKESYYKNTERITNYITYEYDDTNKKLSESYFDSQNNNVSNTKYEYLGDLLVKVESYLPNGELQYSEMKMYDDNNNLTYNKVIDNSIKQVSEEKIGYDSQKNIVSHEFIQNGTTVQSITKGYDDSNRLVETATTSQNGTSKRTLFFETDDKGNWVKKTVLIDKMPVYEIQRVILYY
ncbi:hypothetical protein [Flavobacterium orientale]|uniref:YD repeat-containing protein n=1 Tax=Flavobacterium orientale TaxID=1756020 RepID=A0A916Y7A0_9FLAO|nr:hypothetical protein [Flavobacterium orientale]GGD32909.1 hypothetical protein GCM10011343_23660 [Flavobacterium orientale]